MPLAPGTQLGPYEINVPLGAGGMGEVYRARDKRLDRTVAIKILPVQFSSDLVLRQRFDREAKTISSLNHPHICVLYDVGHHDGIDYLVMECVEGETLAKRLEKGPLPLEDVLKYGSQVADALDTAHRGGVVHRDLKPGNIMLTATGAKLLDFGLAKSTPPLASGVTLTTAVPTQPMTQEGTIVGTFQYMSPEQIEGKEVDGRSDIFSLGALLYEMLTGQRAFEGRSQLSVASAILEKEPAPISTIKPLTPPALAHAIRRCLAKDPEKRWQSATDLAGELEWIAEAGSQAGVPTPVISHRKLPDRLGWATATLLALVAAALGIGFVSRAPKSPPQPVRLTAEIGADASLFTEFGPSAILTPDGSRLPVYALGHVYLKEGRIQQAEPLLKASLDASSYDPDAWFAYAQAADKTGRKEEARERYIQAALHGSNEAHVVLEKGYKPSNDGGATQLDAMLDARYAQMFPNPLKAEPYRPDDKRTDRVVLAELFTGASCGPCVAADLAFDTAAERYRRGELWPSLA
jgi:eukaryotic-like serine/threonine-protein kinase